jgi:16S rRNA processing protein RimM
VSLPFFFKVPGSFCRNAAAWSYEVSKSEISIEENFRVVGRVKDAHGLKGEIWVVLFAGVADWLDSLKDDGKYILSKKESLAGLAMSDLTEFPIKGARAHKNGVILHSSAVKDRTAAEGFKGHFLVIPEKYLVSQEGDSYFLSEIEGFSVLEDKREIGVITGFSHNGAQDLLQVTLVKGVREGVKAKDVIEIPFVEELVFEVDDESKVIHVELPEGLIEVQLGLDKVDQAAEKAERAADARAGVGEAGDGLRTEGRDDDEVTAKLNIFGDDD